MREEKLLLIQIFKNHDYRSIYVYYHSTEKCLKLNYAFDI